MSHAQVNRLTIVEDCHRACFRCRPWKMAAFWDTLGGRSRQCDSSRYEKQNKQHSYSRDFSSHRQSTERHTCWKGDTLSASFSWAKMCRWWTQNRKLSIAKTWPTSWTGSNKQRFQCCKPCRIKSLVEPSSEKSNKRFKERFGCLKGPCATNLT